MTDYAINDRWKSINEHVPNIVTKRHYADEWTAIDETNYDYDSPVGSGSTQQEAVDDLIEKLEA